LHPNELIEAVSQGSQEALEQLYTLYSAKVYNTAISYVQDIHDAEEITQDVFTNIFRSERKFKGDSELSTWIY
jgi:RNA polymerase sigma factor (sigma-70 family)